jgi:threonine dehydrogenase-like Zn-dependent dehydrogenase
MKALVFKRVGEIALEIVPDPIIQDQSDALVKITTSTICGTDLHLVRGTIPDVIPGTILGHEGVGIVEKIGTNVHSISVGDRVIIPSTIACGNCYYCMRNLTSQCDVANPNGPLAGTAFFGSPKECGPFDGLQAEKARVPFADAMLVKIPDELSDEQVILLSDILPTALMGVEFANPDPADTVAVFGAGPVGQLVIDCLKKRGVQKIISIDHIDARLTMAKNQGAMVINFDQEDPVARLYKETNNRGPDKIIDAVGIDAQYPAKGSPFAAEFRQELGEIAPIINPHERNWIPGNGPSQVLIWALQSIAKAGTLSIIGVYTERLRNFAIGAAMEKNLTIRAGNCNHRHYLPELITWVQNGSFKSEQFITHRMHFDQIVEAYKHFDKRDENWIKVVLSMK